MPTERKTQAPDILTSLTEVADNPEKNSNSLQVLAPILDIAFSHLNHLSIKVDDNLNDPFLISVTDEKERAFPRRSYDNEMSEELPIFSISVNIGKNFNIVQDLPGLTRAIEKQHNSKMEEYGLDNQMLFIDTSKQLRAYWKFIAEKLGVFIKENQESLSKIDTNTGDNKETILTSIIKEYQEVCNILANSFSEEEKSNEELQPKIDATPQFEISWQDTQYKLMTLLERLIETKENSSLIRYQKNPKKFLLRAIGIVGKRAQIKVLEELNIQARDVFFHHSQSELYRKAGLEELKPEDNNIKTIITKALSNILQEHLSNPIVQLLHEKFPDNEQQLSTLKTQLEENKNNLTKAKQENNKNKIESLTSQRVKLQKKLANILNKIVYSKKLFNPDNNSYSFSDTIEKNQVNCMMQGELLHQLWNNYCGETTLGALSNEHFFSVIKLANNTLLSLDFNQKIVETDDENIYELGDHKRIYQSSLFDWKANELSKIVSKKNEAEKLYKQAISLAPNAPSYKSNLANLLSKNPSRYNEAEKLYKQAISLAPNDPSYKSNLANLLSKDPSRYNEAEKLYKQAISLAPNDPSYKSNLAILLNKDPSRYNEAEKLHKQAISLAPNYPSYKSNLANLLSKDPSRYNEAEKLYKQAISLAPNDPWFVTSLANFYHERENGKEKAIKYYKKALELMEENQNSANWLTESEIKKIIENLS